MNRRKIQGLKNIFLFFIIVVLVFISGYTTTSLTNPTDDSFKIKITDMLWDSSMKIIGITFDPFPSKWGNWTMYIDGKEVSMEGDYGKPTIRPNAPLDKSPTGLIIGALPWVSPLTEVNFSCCGNIQFNIPGEGLTNEYEFNYFELKNLEAWNEGNLIANKKIDFFTETPIIIIDN